MSDIVQRLRGWCPHEDECPRVLIDKAAAELERIRAALAALVAERLVAERDGALKQRDEARRLLSTMVEYIKDDTPPNQLPNHYCGHDHRPDLGLCKFCDHWVKANILLYGDEWGEEYREAEKEGGGA